MNNKIIPKLWAGIAMLMVLYMSCRQPNARETYKDKIADHRKAIDELFADPKSSPLSEEDAKNFTGLSYYEPDEKYLVPAMIEKLPEGDVIQLPHTMNRKYPFIRYGRAHFKLGDDTCILTLYISKELAEKKEGQPTLFIPFKDLTNDSDTYEGGRYLDIVLGNEPRITLDFNEAYNPNCAYSHNYSCPMVPAENNLNCAIPAGVKRYRKK